MRVRQEIQERVTPPLNQRVEDGRALAATIRSAEQPDLPTKRHAAKSAFCRVVREADPAVVEEASEGIPAQEHVIDGFGEVLVARQPGELGGEPSVNLGHQRRAQLTAHSEALGGVLPIDGALDIEQGMDPLHGLERDRVPNITPMTIRRSCRSMACALR